MTRNTLTLALCGTLLCAGTARGIFPPPTPQQLCDQARINAWKTYMSCLNRVLASEVFQRGEFVKFARCRQAYFKNWEMFKTKTRYSKPPGSSTTSLSALARTAHR